MRAMWSESEIPSDNSSRATDTHRRLADVAPDAFGERAGTGPRDRLADGEFVRIADVRRDALFLARRSGPLRDQRDRHADVQPAPDALVSVERVEVCGVEESALDLPPGASVGYDPSTRCSPSRTAAPR